MVYSRTQIQLAANFFLILPYMEMMGTQYLAVTISKYMHKMSATVNECQLSYVEVLGTYPTGGRY